MKPFIALAILLLVGYYGFRAWEFGSYIDLLPAQIDVVENISAGGSYGLREGCGAAVFKLSPQTLERILKTGVSALKGVNRARASGSHSYYEYGEWKVTPLIRDYTLSTRWLSGIGCANLDKELNQSIKKALASIGSFYSTTTESGLLIIPNLGIAVLSYEG